jgi:stress response protein SCP2
MQKNWTVYFGNKKDAFIKEAIVHQGKISNFTCKLSYPHSSKGDNRTGEGSGDDERIMLDFDEVPLLCSSNH